MMYKVDLIASLPHYLSHLQPIWDRLPEEVKGDVRTDERAILTPPRNRVCLVASWTDMRPLRGLTKFIYVEHGAGQSYGGGDGKGAHWADYSASGGERHQGVIGYISPSQTVADRWRYAPAVAVGCPRLDPYFMNRHDLRAEPGTVGFVFHWPCKVAPESDTAYWHYVGVLAATVENFTDHGWRCFATGHPKWEGSLDGPLRNHGLTLGPTSSLLCEVLIVDNSSVAYEAAAIGRHVVSLNAPGYRRDVDHGLRFWDHVPGIQIDEPEQLLALDLRRDVVDNPESARLRDRAAEHAYAFRDGSSAQRAADAVMAWLA